MKTSTFYRSVIIVALFALGAFTSHAQFAFTNSNNLLTVASHSGCAVTVVDVNNDGLDDILKMEESRTLVLELQNRDGSFSRTSLGLIPDNNEVWGMAAADVDHNGWKDVATGSGACYLYKLFYNAGVVTATITQLPQNYFVQNITFGDFNNDGWADLEVCDDDDYAKVYVNTAGTLTPTTTLINTNINPGMYYGNDPYDSGNYGSVWTDIDNDNDLDLYIAHCRQSASSSNDQRRRDRLFINDGNNNYSEQGQSHGIEVTDFKQTWTTSFGDLDNDGDMDIVMTNHGENGQILQNNGTGHFADITVTTGFTTPGTDPIESFVEDFDNDGFLDILISGGGPGNSYFLYRNNGNMTFTLATLPFASTTNGMLSFAAGDLNHDGKVDIFASYGNVYNNPTSTDDILWLNSTNNSNHYITFALTGTVSNLGGIGAKVTIYGPWGKQVREVRAGESYGTSNSMQCHFGLSSSTVIDSAVIHWPSHQETHFGTLAVDQFVTAVEGTCTITDNVIPGPYIFCSGQSLTLNAAAGFATYNWSNGATTQSITITTPGIYNVAVTSANGCSSISPSINAQLNPDETPTVTAAGALEFCQGGSVTLTSTPATSYLWSNGATTQSISVNQSGSYSLTIQGFCGSFNSVPVSVNVLAAPLPVVTGASGVGPTSLTLSATGNTLSWYDQQFGGTLLGTGTSFTTPVLTVTTTYWVENATSYPGPTDYTGQTYHEGTSLYSSGTTTNGSVDFDVTTPCTLVSVKVYTDTPGDREVDLLNSAGTVINSQLVTIPMDSSRITLNFPLTPGTGYRLTTNAAVNITNLGTVTPRLQRSNQGVMYPYTVNNVLSLTGSNQGGAYYYYFYDWEVEEQATVCVSDRVPVDAVILPVGISSISSNSGFSIYPNPVKNFLNIKLPGSFKGSISVKISDLTGRIVSDNVYNAASDNLKINLKDYAKGAYIVKLVTDKDEFVQRIVVE